MAHRTIPQDILAYLNQQQAQGLESASTPEIARHLGAPRPTVNDHLARLVRAQAIVRVGAGRSTRYRLPEGAWSVRASALRTALKAPLASRDPVTYQRNFLEGYDPQHNRLLPEKLASELHELGRMPGQAPAGTYARRVLEQLLIDLSWYSSRLEGNTLSLLDTRELFARGRTSGDDLQATMLLNHKETIEFLVDAVPTYGICLPVVRNTQSLLMNGLLDDPDALGTTRRIIVNISDTTYVPSQVPALLDEMLELIVQKARLIRNPVECAFFLWVNIAYLQPFQDGNKRTSRMCANLPLLLANCAPLSFLDVEREDYAFSMLGVYEKLDVSLAVDLFDWTYRRSIARYRTVLEAAGLPNPFRARYREALGEVVRRVVEDGLKLEQTISELTLPDEDRSGFLELAQSELNSLGPHNCARYRLSLSRTEAWLESRTP